MRTSTFIYTFIIAIMLLIIAWSVCITFTQSGLLFSGIGVVTLSAGSFLMGTLTGRDVHD